MPEALCQHQRAEDHPSLPLKAQLACHMRGRLRGPAPRRETRAAVAGGANDVVPRGKQVHAAAKVGAQGADGGGSVLAVGGTDCDDLAVTRAAREGWHTQPQPRLLTHGWRG